MRRAYYSATISEFRRAAPAHVLGEMARLNPFALTGTQRDAWLEQAALLRDALADYEGTIHFEFDIPRMGRRIDAVLLIGPVVFVLEFKVGARVFTGRDRDQVTDYALDLHHFHEGSHRRYLAPILIATDAAETGALEKLKEPDGFVLEVVEISPSELPRALAAVLALVEAEDIDAAAWENSRYKPTPTIIEATLALYRGHSVVEIARTDAGVSDLAATAASIAQVVRSARDHDQKAICFVTGVPGAGKTLIGLNAATEHVSRNDELYSVFLSGNGPLVAVLQEALARDRVAQAQAAGQHLKKGEARSTVKTFIQNVHHFRDECLKDALRPPIEHVAIFDEAQRAWTLAQTSQFMKRKKGIAGFSQSEPEFLISCIDRHPDWGVIICLVGGGQEINTGEAGISEWILALNRSFPHWKVFVSDRLTDTEYGAGEVIAALHQRPEVEFLSHLHLATSVRSFRSEKVSLVVKQILDLDPGEARSTFEEVRATYPIVITRDVQRARRWLRRHARGSERYGIMVSSQAERLKPHALDVKTPVDPVHWFLNSRDDVRSSYYLEDVATEFHVQGLEVDWGCVVWDADFRYTPHGWKHWSFRGNRWQHIHAAQRQRYLKNAYRVLLTRARQGMVIVVPEGDPDDPTRAPEFYDQTFEYLVGLGIPLATG